MKKRLIIYTLLISALLAACSNSKQKSSVEIFNQSGSIVSLESYASLSNKLWGWGMRRTPDGPEFTAQQEATMEKYSCIYRGAKTDKSIYLTFDEGYENGYTSIILDVLREKNVPAAFFVTGAYVKNEPDLIKRMAREGHIIGNHTMNHPSMPSLKDGESFTKELVELDRLIFGLTKKQCRFFRPPKGEYSDRVLAIVKDMGYTTVFWSLAFVDWDNKISAEEAEKKVFENLHGGCVMLLHAVSKGNAQALGNVIDRARKEGYEFKSLKDYKP
ncbi:MAG: polysaccharide deacetylase family protein [Clostridia bacterium]|nr:polysaccharide deacetylase family protein [Clostridia bacterium]